MGVLKRFNKIFGKDDSVEEEKMRFVERVNQIIFHRIDTEQVGKYNYYMLFDLVCFELGVDAKKFEEREIGWDSYISATIRTLTKDNFENTLLVLCALYNHIEYDSDSNRGREWLSKQIKSVLSRRTCDIGVRWKDGLFYPTGVEELGKPLIEETLTWLNDYPNERKDYGDALKSYSAGEPSLDVIRNCYSAVEGLAREVLGNKKTLDNNKNELLARTNLSEGWNRILATYITYAHDYRHASPERHDITKQEAEAYLYMTGLIIRLIVESK